MKYKVLLTGSSGYIGGCFNKFFQKKFKIFSLDKNIPKFLNQKEKKNFIKCNLLNLKKLKKIINKIQPDIVIHLAAQSTVNEKISWEKYYKNNVVATKNLISAMKQIGVKKIIFSSTAAVYKEKKNKIFENDKIRPISKYGKSKLTCEKEIIKNKKINYVILRFFNVCSAIKKPLIGEFHNPETHLIPIAVSHALNGKKINIFGKNYKTTDGTCERDYIHIKDICLAIKNSIMYLLNKDQSQIINIGNGKTISNMKIIKSLKKIFSDKLNYSFIDKRKGDTPRLFCNTNKAKKLIKWTTKNSNIKKILLDEIVWNKFLINKKLKRRFLSVQK